MPRRNFEIVLARTAGFCMGVRRAVRMVLDAANDPRLSAPIKTHGPLIHNRQVLGVLESRGVLTTADSPGDGGTAVIRAHGLSRRQQDELRSRCEELLDATCPHVRRVQDIVREYSANGYLCVVVGDAGHAEVEAVLSYAGPAGHVVGGPEEVDGLPPAEKVAVVAQTTQDEQVFSRTVERVRARYGDCLAFQTICQSTGQRQAEVRELAGRVDAMVVVGSPNSANTRRLAEISAETGTPTFQVETERDLDVDRLLRCERVGLTAGASTPSWMIKKVIRRLQDAYLESRRPLAFRLLRAGRAMLYANVYAAGGAAALTFANVRLLPQRPPSAGLCMAVSFFFILAQLLLNHFARRQSLYLSRPERADFLMANERSLFVLGVSSSGLALALAYFLGWWAFGLVTLGTLGGLMYRLRLPPALAGRLRFLSLEQLPGSKELFVGLAWGALAAVVPSLAAGPAPARWGATALAFGASFLLAFQRTLALDVQDVQTDQLVGRETLAGILGPRASGRLFLVLTALVAAVLAGGSLMGWTTPFGFAFLAAVPCALVGFVVLRRLPDPGGELGEVAMDGVFYAIGLLGLAWMAAPW